jgi:hypothetical protein
MTGLHREPTPATTQPAPLAAVDCPVIQELLCRSLALETQFYGCCSGGEVFLEDEPLVIALDRIEHLDFELFGVEPRGGSNELDYQLEPSPFSRESPRSKVQRSSCRAFRPSKFASV